MVPWLRRPVLRDPLERLIAQSRPPYEKAVREFGWRCWQMTLMSAAIWAISAPLVMARFHVAAPIALLLNVPLGLPVAVSLLSGFGVMLFGSWLSPVAHLCAIVCDASLALLQTIVEKAQGISWGHAWVTGPAEWWLAGFYLLILGFMLLGRWCPPRRWCVAWVALWIATGVGTRWIAPKDETLCCTFVSVGHGLAVLIELPDGRAMLYDAGQLASPRWSARAISEVLWSRGITHLDAVVVSHADVDHYNGLPTLLDRFSVGAVYTSTVMFTEESGALIALRDALAGQEIPIRELSASDRFELSEGDIQVWHPPAQGLLASDNANSIVLAIEYRGRRILLTGDLESPGLEMVMSEEPYDCDLVLAPHHGSRRSNSAELARWCTPEWVVVSGPEEENGTLLQQAYQQAYQQPHQGAAGDAEPGQGESRARSVRVLYTTRHGAITARIGPQGQFDVDWFRR
jgi:competence protein ComEC